MAIVGINVAVALRFNQKSRVDELVWEKSVVWLGNTALSLTVPVVWVNLIIDRQKVSSGETVLQRRGRTPRRQPSPTLELVDHQRNAVLGDGKDNRDRLELGDHNQPIGVSRLHEVPRIDQGEARLDR